MNKNAINLISFLVLLVGIICFGFWQTTKQANTKNAQAIVIGSKNFTESKIVMQIYADALSKNHYQVRTKPNISSSVVFQAAKSGQIDLYPEYTGTIAMTYLSKNLVGKNASQIATIARKGIAKNNLVTLNYAPANDAQGLVITNKAANKYHIKTIADLQRKAKYLRFISQGEFDKRQDGLIDLTKVYGPFKFKSHKLYDQSLRYELLDKNQGDVTTASTTEGQLATGKYRVLVDNKRFWPAYNLVPVIRKNIIGRYPEIQKILNQIDQKLTTKELTKLNKKVDVDGQNYQKVAQDWLKHNYERR
ncbi:MAG: glycine/betaine ABC transporter substrate-binding protein [Lactobacillus sp.]|jgi:osmoprotectant transport system substrate-binding protein|nr:glycine/betaine ABC transporter substrate-binding protein [Lactobacillus sp.]